MGHSYNWVNMQSIGIRGYDCSWCGRTVSAHHGYGGQNTLSLQPVQLYPCPHCGKPTFFEGTEQFPVAAPGASVKHVPSQVSSLYEEARRAAGANCHTAAVLLCRKLLMNLGVALGAAENLKFIQYVEYLSDKGYVPPNGKTWVDHIRDKGNEATHEIAMMSASDSTDLITFSEMLLKFVYEFPMRVPTKPVAKP